VDGRSDGELLRACRQDPDAFAEFYRRHERALLGFLSRHVEEAEIAAQLAAETFAAALLRARRHRDADAPAAAWLYGIAREQVRRTRERGRVDDSARRRLRMPRLVLDAVIAARIDAAGAAERAEHRLAQTTSAGPALLVVEEEPRGAIAAALEDALRAAAQRLHEARRRRSQDRARRRRPG
jgi:DNA-directed RNA polymerase specialized sigma24 family protein